VGAGAGAGGSVEKPKKYREVLHLSVRDALPAWGPISSITFSLAGDGVSFRVWILECILKTLSFCV